MSRPATDKRDRLADAALGLAYESGFERASIAEIAERAGVAPGSVYYYFKTKDDVGRAVVDHLASRYGAAMARWDGLAGPSERLEALIASYEDDIDQVRLHGCPLGTVCAELGKYSAELGHAAGAVFDSLIAWVTAQFVQLGVASAPARVRGIHTVAVLQGAAALSSAIDSDDPLIHEAAYLRRWIAALSRE